ncbi:acetyl-CoA carboxylase biotin carboxyl carrier protein subunit [Cupriavidus sp. L7L]|uniref:acetyl-CoA carboxylase biotin carboxyl carrier protein subunit n=1 Tax=Cupriavidus sp. L7L TaxID=2546443 RepID=UPI001054FADB|nr:acetyl-CoA carboxylase biotin carboxyl carrier protein subunit [Cupriavidus sp. L7L]TDF61952.1 biotin/lipoyl-binding protein [Cupriavidus sp. L7L]
MAHIEIQCEVTGKVWKTLVPEGTPIAAEEPILIVESMKMEIPVMSDKAGTLIELRVQEGDAVEDGQVIAIVRV